MTNLISNILFDKSFPNERIDTTQPFKDKKMEKDVKQIFKIENIIDYRCYLSKTSKIIYYMVETKTHYITYKEDLITKEQDAFCIKKEEFNEIK